MQVLWYCVVCWEDFWGIPYGWSVHWANYRGYRKARGGRWGLWEVGMRGPLRIWWPSACEHYPAPILAMHTEPIEAENW